MKDMDSRNAVRNLAESIHSLLGFKAHLTSAWVNSVCSIIRNLPPEATPAALCEVLSISRGLSTDQKSAVSDSDIIKIKDEVETLTASISQLNAQRKQVLNELLNLKGNIRVFCRIRPTFVGDNFSQLSSVENFSSSDLLLKIAGNKSKHYIFDKVFHPNASQDEVFSDVEPIIKSVLDGYNACIFAYGQTGSGKTFTMEGTPESPGVVPRGMEALFEQATLSNCDYLFTFSMLEIYLGILRDLLLPHTSKVADLLPCLSVQTDPKGGIEIDNLVAVPVSNFRQALKLYRLGCRLRSTASTCCNKTSSRSHCMIRVRVTSFNAPERRRKTNNFWMIDLGGSERVLKSKARGRRFEEGRAINLSLSALGDVINALQIKKCHIPYRNSKLTQVLQDSLGEDSKTLILVHVSPEDKDLSETVCSLSFATRARNIHLGNAESRVTKERKEVAMISLQQKIKQIEDERQEIRGKIMKLNKRLETLKSSCEQLQVSHPIRGESEPSVNSTDRIRNVPKPRSLELPRFMQPTVCGKRKSGTEWRVFEEKASIPVRRHRRQVIQRADSVSFPLKRSGIYSSDCSVSRTSCAMDLKMISNGDNVTQHSQGTSECDIRTIDFQLQEKRLMNSDNQLVHGDHNPTYSGNPFTNGQLSTSLMGEDNLEKREKNKKEMLSIPGDEMKIFKLHANQDEAKNWDDVQVDQRPNVGVISFDRNDSFCSSHSTGIGAVPQKQGLEHGFADSTQVRHENGFTKVVVERAAPWKRIIDITECDEDCTLDHAMHARASQPDKCAGIIERDLGSESVPVISTQFLEFLASTRESTCNAENMDPSPTPFSKEIGPLKERPRSQRALLMEKLKKDSGNISTVNSHVFVKSTGTLTSIKQIIQMLYFCALLGLGFRSFGYPDGFYKSLMH